MIILQRIGVLTFSPIFRLGGPTAFLGVCIPATLRATRATRGVFIGDLLGIALSLDSVVLAMAKSFCFGVFVLQVFFVRQSNLAFTTTQIIVPSRRKKDRAIKHERVNTSTIW